MPGNDEWFALPGRLNERVLEEILTGGQSFLWEREATTGTWWGHWGRYSGHLRCRHRRAEIRPGPETTPADALVYWGDEHRHRHWRNALPWRGDVRLQAAMTAFPGLRLLRQPPGETLLAFLLSSTKPIAQIRLLLQRLANAFGETLPESTRHRLPTWARLAEVSEPELRELGLGYRARYVHAVAGELRQRPPRWLDQLADLSYPEARGELMALPGIGAKIADCVLLFGFAKIEAFPIDTWILKVLGQTYGLGDLQPRQLEHFAQLHFAPAPGLAQQYLFASIRASKKTAIPG
jgi:N-glycosylase/DNA lyase